MNQSKGKIDAKIDELRLLIEHFQGNRRQWQYPPKIKQRIIKLSTKVKSRRRLAKRLGISESVIYSWTKKQPKPSSSLVEIYPVDVLKGEEAKKRTPKNLIKFLIDWVARCVGRGR